MADDKFDTADMGEESFSFVPDLAGELEPDEDEDAERVAEESETSEEIVSTEEAAGTEVEVPTGTGEVKAEPEVDEIPVLSKEDLEKEIAQLEEKRTKLTDDLETQQDKYYRWRDAARDARAAHFQGREAPPIPDEGERPQAPIATPTKPRPAEADFETYDRYIDALTDWKVEQKLAEYDRQTAERDYREDLGDFKARVQREGREKYDDFEDVAEDPIVPIHEGILQILRETERPADIAYYLGKNMKEAAQIARMNPIQTARAISAIEAKLAAPTVAAEPEPTSTEVVKPEIPPKKPTAAPPPISPVKGGGAKVTKDPARMSNEEYRLWRLGQLK